MTELPKYLLLDKSILHGTSTNDLCRFVEGHNVVLPDVLFYECATTDEKKKQEMLDRYKRAILAGGLYCPRLKAILHAEAKDLKPYGSLVDREYDASIRRTFRRHEKLFDPDIVGRTQREEGEFFQYERSAVDQFCKHDHLTDAEGIKEKIEYLSRKWRLERLRVWARHADCMDLHDSANRLLEGITDHPEQYCLSDEWISWHLVRVWLTWWRECTFLRQRGRGLDKLPIEHDWQDMTSVVLLSRTGGLLMCDKAWQDLAAAAFPNKDVFSSLEEVPDSYRCDWADR
jgi:hypothetical protein